MLFEVWPWQIWRLVQVFGQNLCYGVKNILCGVFGAALLHGTVQPLMLIYVVKSVMVREGLKFSLFHGV